MEAKKGEREFGDHNGMFLIKGLSDGRLNSQQNLLEANASNLVSGNTYYYRIRGTNSQGTDWADSTASFVSENALDASTGTVTFNTNGPKPTWSSTGGQGGSGQLVTTSYTDASQNTITYTGKVRFRPHQHRGRGQRNPNGNQPNLHQRGR